MAAHGSDNTASRFPESLSEAQISGGKMRKPSQSIKRKRRILVLFLNIILRLNFTREAEIVTIARNNCQLPSLFTNFKIPHKNTKIVFFFCTDSLVWYMLM